MKITTDMIKSLRESTGCGIMDCRTALQSAEGNFDRAAKILREKGLKKAAKRADKEASEGMIDIYSHGNGRLAVMVEINCETDFVSRSPDFRELVHEIALQIAAASPLYVSDEDIPEEVIAHETKLIEDRVRSEGKPEKVIPRIIEGYLKKFKDETVLLHQAYIRDDIRTVQDLINDKVISLGEKIIIRRFERWALGELSKIENEIQEA